MGLRATPATPWRFLTQVVTFRLLYLLVGPSPFFFFLFSLAIHLLNVFLLYRLCLELERPSHEAFTAALLFGCFPLTASALSHAVNINDFLALTFVLLMVRSFVSWRTPMWYLLALLCKESVLFMPLLGFVRRPPASRNSSLARLAPTLAILVLACIVFFVLRASALGPSGTAYAMRFGFNVVHSLMTYTHWAVDFLHPLPDLVRSYDAKAWAVGAGVLAVFGAVLVFDRERRSVVRFGMAWYLLGLLPVLPLLYSAYNHYLYESMAGFAIAASGVLASLLAATVAALRRLATSRPADPASGAKLVAIAMTAVAIAYAARSNSLIESRWSLRVAGVDLPMDPALRSAAVARAAVLTAADGMTAETRRIVILTPPESVRYFGARSGREYRNSGREGSAYDLTRVVLDDGRALRLFYPQLDSVAFAEGWDSRYLGFDLYLRSPEGRLMGFGRDARAQARAIDVMVRNGWDRSARAHLAAASAAFPNDSALAAIRDRLAPDAPEQPDARRRGTGSAPRPWR